MHKQKTVMCRDHTRLAGYAVVTEVCHCVGVLARTQYEWLIEKYVQRTNTDITWGNAGWT